jgi:outer membrane protein OmpA-like peptidoglycan-associated protein
MLNGLYDIELGLPVKPFVGAGAGFSIISWNPVNRTLNNIICCRPFFGATSPVFGADNPIDVTNDARDADIVASVQIMAGVSYEIPGVPGLSLNVQYRWFDAPHNIQISNFLTLTPINGKGPVLTGQGATTYSGHIDQSVIFGLTYAFNRPPPRSPVAVTPVAVPPSPVSRSYLVFFDWDKAVLTDRARQIVAEAAAASTKVQVTRIEVNGYTDTSGTPTYNQGMSVRRAEAVAAELVKDGVPKNEIAIMGYGETHLLVPTAVGVREPQNRRVEIILK